MGSCLSLSTTLTGNIWTLSYTATHTGSTKLAEGHMTSISHYFPERKRKNLSRHWSAGTMLAALQLQARNIHLASSSTRSTHCIRPHHYAA